MPRIFKPAWCSGIILTLTLGAGASHATIVTLPTDLMRGDQYRLVFVTDGKRDATSDNIADYNTFVTAQAALSPELVALGTTWSVIGSSEPGVDARDNTNTNPTTDGAGVPIYTLANTIVASGNSDLWDGSIANPISTTQSGAVLDQTSGDFIATGSKADGTANGPITNPRGYALGNTLNARHEIGWAVFTDARWVFQDAAALATFDRRFYAMSDILSVPVPATPILLGLGLVGIAAMRRKRLNA